VKEESVSKVIKSKADHERAMASIDRLMLLDPAPDTPEGEELELLVLLVREFESKAFPMTPPTPIEALRFRMEHGGLAPRDLVPYIGSRARVSEVLSGKRSMTLPMLRALHFGLGIPAASLLGETTSSSGASPSRSEFDEYPVSELLHRRWLSIGPRATQDELTEALDTFLRPATALPVLTRRGNPHRASQPNSIPALTAWVARVIQVAHRSEPGPTYRREMLTPAMLSGLVHLSALSDGPRKAKEYLSQFGIALIAVPHLPETYLDGAVFFATPEHPIIGVTLRFNRLDNFWFTLMHEIGHLFNDFKGVDDAFFDDLELAAAQNPREAAADRFAQDLLIPPTEWERSPARLAPTPDYVREFARHLAVHPAVVAGRIRKERANYRLLTGLLGRGEVRTQFMSTADGYPA
jgi:HTH-type transcriptional regulator/antitoxin HigA